MFLYFRASVLAFSAALVVSSCTGPSGNSALEIKSNDPFGEHPLSLKAGRSDTGELSMPVSINKFTSSDFREALTALDSTLCKPDQTLKKCLQNLRKTDRAATKNFKGLSGFTGQTLLRAAQSTIDLNEAFEAPDVKISGQIQPYCLHNPKLRGYAFDKARKTMRICVVVKTTIEHPGVNQNDNNKDPRVRFQYFHVEAAGKVGVDDGAGGTPTNAFPAAAANTGLAIPQSLPDSFVPALNHKLYAWGDGIRVMNYWETDDEDANGSPVWKANRKYARKGNGGAPNGPKRIRDFFAKDDDACIDMLFLGEPPAYLDPAVYKGGVSYCMGRCKNPPIVNTR